MRSFLTLFAILFAAAVSFAQVPVPVGVQILKAEDARRYDSVLEKLLASPDASIRMRAALAAGRIGKKEAVEPLAAMLAKDASADVRAMAAFAIGEIESPAGSEALLTAAASDIAPPNVIARIVEAAGKIAAANPKDERSEALGEMIVDKLDAEAARGDKQDRDVILLGITAVMRARPAVGVSTNANSEKVVTRSPAYGVSTVAKFLASGDARVRADALNTLVRLGYKDDLGEIRSMLRRDADAAVRANAASVLGRAKDKEAYPLLIDAALNGDDIRVRVASIRALAGLNDPNAAAKLIERGQQMLIPVHGDPVLKPGMKTSQLKPVKVPLAKNELLEIAAVVGRLLEKTDDASAVSFLTRLAEADGCPDPETFIALARVSPKAMIAYSLPSELGYRDFHTASAYGQGLGEISATKDSGLIAQAGEKLTGFIAGMVKGVAPAMQSKMSRAMPDLIGAMVSLEPDNIDEILCGLMTNGDPFIRAAAASSIGERPSSKENIEALKAAFIKSMLTDKHEDDATLAIMDALAKLDKRAGIGTFSIALSSNDYLVRKMALTILDDPELQKEFPGLPLTVAVAREKGADQVQPYMSAFDTKLGQILNTDADYRRAATRKNGSVKAVVTTEKGVFTIVFDPEEAPLTVDNFVKLARAGYFNGLEVHRVVPNFVMQDGDPRGDGNGSPGWSIRCEINTLPYDRGAVGMALSGKDTGGSQWFVTHTATPHLDGGYTVFGHVSESDMKVVDNIARGDKIISIKIIGL